MRARVRVHHERATALAHQLHAHREGQQPAHTEAVFSVHLALVRPRFCTIGTCNFYSTRAQ